jgi:putative FmdB family regulatory protein
MPFYDYLCDDCGPFTLMRPMAECEHPSDCPDCGASAPRAYLRAPNFSCMSADARTAHATNERSAAAPISSSQFKAKHGKGCGCCTPSRSLKRDKDGGKHFPTKRPWMISH